MTRRRSADDLSFILGQRGRKRKRSARIRRRRRAGLIAGTLLIALIVIVAGCRDRRGRGVVARL